QQGEARLSLDLPLPDEAVVDEHGKPLEHVVERNPGRTNLVAEFGHGHSGSRVTLEVADRLGRPKAPAAGEDGEPAEENLYRRLQQLPGPGDGRAEGLLARGAERAPLVRRGSRRSRRASSAAGGKSLLRAAASSMASGSPSRRRQISPTAAAFSAVRANA